MKEKKDPVADAKKTWSRILKIPQPIAPSIARVKDTKATVKDYEQGERMSLVTLPEIRLKELGDDLSIEDFPLSWESPNYILLLIRKISPKQTATKVMKQLDLILEEPEPVPDYYKYKGENSREFWDRVNALEERHGELYSLGVVLQNIEEYVLRMLEQAEADKDIKVYSEDCYGCRWFDIDSSGVNCTHPESCKDLSLPNWEERAEADMDKEGL